MSEIGHVIVSDFEHLDDIAAMDGIDSLSIGPQDLAQDLGVFGTPDQDRVLDGKRAEILAATKKHGKTCAMMATSAAQAHQLRDDGVLIVNYSSDVNILIDGYKAALSELRG